MKHFFEYRSLALALLIIFGSFIIWYFIFTFFTWDMSWILQSNYDADAIEHEADIKTRILFFMFYSITVGVLFGTWFSELDYACNKPKREKKIKGKCILCGDRIKENKYKPFCCKQCKTTHNEMNN